MERIRSDIAKGSFVNFYLLYGNEEVLKKQNRDRLIKAMLPDGDDMNISYFKGESIDAQEITDTAQTLPFFADRRLLVISDSGWFKKAPEGIADVLSELSETSFFIFTEKDVDKRNKLFGLVKTKGHAAEIKTPSDDELVKMIGAHLSGKGFKVSGADCAYLLGKTGSDVARLQTELDKLTAYAYGQESITRADINAICSEIPEGRIFSMLDDLMSGNSDRAFERYTELIAAQERPMNILSMLNRSYNQLCLVHRLAGEGRSRAAIIETLGIRDFQYDKYAKLLRTAKPEELWAKRAFGIELEKRVKTGDLDERAAVEIFIVKNKN